MPEKYHIKTKPVPPRRPRIGKHGVVDWREDCARCHNCVKKACVYDRYRQEAEYIRTLHEVDALFFDCMGCFSCVQDCTKGLLCLSVNPEYEKLGNRYWKPEILKTTWLQAETAKIPVSGAGYRGPFSGHGFDSMWTDMSEIVRPTRDGIHGREYISTAVDIGKKPSFLALDGDRAMASLPPLVSIPMPLILDLSSPKHTLPQLDPIIEQTAADTGLMAIMDSRHQPAPDRDLGHVVFYLGPKSPPPAEELLRKTRMVEIADNDNVTGRIREIKKAHPSIVISVRVELTGAGVGRAIELAGLEEVEVLHVVADPNGDEIGAQTPRFLKEMVRQIHAALIDNGTRDEITLMAGGGIALPEHLAKAIICGADLVTINLPLLIALECHLCESCAPGMPCPARLEQIDRAYGVGRMTNLIAAWHDQLIEVMGAMGMREVRRLRGEIGRAMFFENLEEETFGKLFGSRRLSMDSLPENTLKTRVPQEKVERVVQPARSRYRNEIGRYVVHRSLDCRLCGRCAEVCSYHVHVRKSGYKYFAEASHHLCIGPSCEHTGRYCVTSCPQGALQIRANPMHQVLGDCRWPADLILATWRMAETGQAPPPEYGYDYECGNSGGGFDRLRFKFPDRASPGLDERQIDTSVLLNKRDDGRPKVRIDVPWYGGGMSFGSVSNVTQLSKARAAVAWNTFTCTGEGGFMERMRPYDDHVITQVATGLFGVREETIQRVPIVEFKYAQGAKPGLGGHLLGDKNTPAVARMREAVLGISLFSPFPFHSVYSIEDHAKHIEWIKHVNRRALISTKVSTPTDVDMVAVGSYSAGTHIVHIDGGYGGTGAAPDIAKKNIAMPIEYAIGRVHNFLAAEGVRDNVTLIASGGIRSAHDIAKAIALGADGVVIGTAEMVALGCVRCSRCESGRGCPRGIATTDPDLSAKMNIVWGTQRLINLYSAWRKTLVGILQRLGMRSVSELRGRTDLLMHLDYTNDKPAGT